MRKFELIPLAGQKSFNGLAVVDVCDNWDMVLYSYNTVVCSWVSGAFFRHWGKKSATTMKHVNAFRAACGLDKLSMREWEELPVVKYEEV